MEIDIIAISAAELSGMYRVIVTFSSMTEDVVFDSPALVQCPPRTPAQWAVVLGGLAQMTLDDDARADLRAMITD